MTIRVIRVIRGFCRFCMFQIRKFLTKLATLFQTSFHWNERSGLICDLLQPLKKKC